MPEHEEQDPGQRGEVDALAGHDVVHRREHVGDGVLALGPQRVGGLLLGDPGRDLRAEDAGEDQVGGVAEDLRADRVEQRRCPRRGRRRPRR